jgi:glucuronate isomerase
MTAFLPENYLLQNEKAGRLYHGCAVRQPIFDYHCHLPPAEIAANRRFENLTRVWLAGDHYKWRALRALGVPEELITGDHTSDYDKFLAYAAAVPALVRNPLHHWSHLELRRYFGINRPINAANAPGIWEEANARLAEPALVVHGILKKFDVRVICTTDDPTDDLAAHAAIAGSDLATRVYPTFRPDKAHGLADPIAFNAWVDRLAARADLEITSLTDFLTALDRRHAAFHALGGRLSDHGLECVPDVECTEGEARAIFAAARAGRSVTPRQEDKFTWFMLLHFGRLDAQRGWTKQLHLGALRNNNSRLRRRLGADAGVDSIGDFPQARALSRYLDHLDREEALPQVVLYNLNPADNYLLAAMTGNFQDGRAAGKLQFGSGWWFLDQKEGMEWQLNALSQLGVLSRFVGMLTDSRSFLSYVRHEYFRRILCNLIGGDVEAGLIPDDTPELEKLIQGICYDNAAAYFGLALPN